MFKNAIEHRVTINADSTLVGEALSRLDQYSLWNSATRFTRQPLVGHYQVMQVKLFTIWLAVPVRILHCNQQQGLRWQGGIPALFTGSHYFRTIDNGDNTTTLVQGEDFKGLLVPLLLPLLKNTLNRLYHTINRDLKAHCENAG